MKYYDTYLPYIIDDDYDWSYPAPEMQLLWRLDDLQDRLEELMLKTHHTEMDIFTQRMTLDMLCPNIFFDIGKVERAIELAKDDLVNKYGLPDPDTLIFDESEVATEDCVGQMTLLDLLSEELPKAA